LKISELFIVSSVGLVTSADKTLIDQSKDELLKKLTQAKEFDGQGKVHDRLQDKEIEPDYVKRVSYRPFDDQYIYYDTKVIERARENVMQHFLQGKNLGLMVCRQQKTEGFYHALVHEHIVESSYVSNRTSEIGSTFPLYVYHDDGTRTTNFKTEVLNHFMKNVQSPFEPEDVIDYIYASLYSPQYRSIYKEFLKADFPRVPAPKNDAEFHRLSILGKELRELHLMISNSANDFITTFPEPGSNEIYKITYNDNRVWINSTQFFGGVPETVWHSYIGAYQPAQKWLKDRAGHKLSNEDIEQYQRIIKVLAETYEIMHKIDAK
jgi:predicted helicase